MTPRRLVVLVVCLTACVPPASKAWVRRAFVPPSLDRPFDRYSCAYESPYWHSQRAMHLRFDSVSSPFAAVYAAERVMLELPESASLGAWLSMTVRWPDTSQCLGGCVDNEAELAAVVAADDVPLFAKSPTVVAGFAIPYSHTPVHWRGSPPNFPAVDVELALSDVTMDEPLAWQPSCEHLSLVPGDFDAAGVVGAIGDGTVLWAPNDVSLHRTPGDPPVGLVKGGIAEAWVLERTATHVRIWWNAAEAVLFGWVAADALEPLEPGGRSHRARPPRLRKPTKPRGRAVMCRSPLHIVGRADGRFFTVGRIVRSDHEIHVRPQSENYLAFELSSWGTELPVDLMVTTPSSLVLNRAEVRDACRY